MTRFACCVLMLLACFAVSARDVRMHGPNGDGGACPEASGLPSIIPTTPATRHAPAMNHGKAKAPSSFRGSDDDGVPHMPRWHSFLPGMFR